MSRLIISIFCLSLLSACAQLGDVESEADLRVLFVGNSLSYYNDLPSTVRSLAASQTPVLRLHTEMLAQGGATLAQHLKTGIFAEELSRADYDFVVLQEMGGWPLCPNEAEGCESFGAVFRDAVDAVRSSGAEPIWYSTWQIIPAAQVALSAEASRVSSTLGVTMVDAGGAIFEYRNDGGLGDPLMANGHPTPTGTRIVAMGLVAAMQAREFVAPNSPTQICGTPWQGSDLKLESLSSSQVVPDNVCYEVLPKELSYEVGAANNALHLHSGS